MSLRVRYQSQYLVDIRGRPQSLHLFLAVGQRSIETLKLAVDHFELSQQLYAFDLLRRLCPVSMVPCQAIILIGLPISTAAAIVTPSTHTLLNRSPIFTSSLAPKSKRTCEYCKRKKFLHQPPSYNLRNTITHHNPPTSCAAPWCYS
jgi:hypothetical protein